jgi:hypothetical protein
MIEDGGSEDGWVWKEKRREGERMGVVDKGCRAGVSCESSRRAASCLLSAT